MLHPDGLKGDGPALTSSVWTATVLMCESWKAWRSLKMYLKVLFLLFCFTVRVQDEEAVCQSDRIVFSILWHRKTTFLFNQGSHIHNSVAPVIYKWLNLPTCKDQFTPNLGQVEPKEHSISVYFSFVFFCCLFPHFLVSRHYQLSEEDIIVLAGKPF